MQNLGHSDASRRLAFAEPGVGFATGCGIANVEARLFSTAACAPEIISGVPEISGLYSVQRFRWTFMPRNSRQAELKQTVTQSRSGSVSCKLTSNLSAL